jgi:Secretion system C-terminal sorting domain
MGAYESSYTPLPLKLVSFEGKLEGNQIRLNWKTAGEENTSYFDIEYGTDGSFSTIGTVSAAGSSNTVKNYTFTHQTPASGTNYYRLKMLDKDGAFTYSDVVPVNVSLKQSDLKIYPNPTRGEVWVQHLAGSDFAQLKLVSMAGKVLKTVSLVKDTSQTQLDLSGLNPGIYNLVWTDGLTTQSQSLVIE